MAFTVYMEHKGEPISMLLDLVEIAKSHSGINLAKAFEKVLKDFGVSDKVSIFLPNIKIDNLPSFDT